jgi:RHS repeat-associated protein
VREHLDPVFRSRLRAQVVGGVLRITPTASGGGGRPGWLPVPAEAQLRAVYVYDVYNRRTMSVLVGESVRYYAWDGWRNVVEAEHVYDGTSPATWQAAPVKQFVWGAELDELVSYRRKVPTATVPAWETYYLLHGGQETAAKLVDANGEVVEQYEYDPYGRATVFSKVAGQWTSGVVSRYGLPFLWKAVRLDEVTGLLQMRNRYYSVETGRFLTRDPIGVWGDVGNLGNEYGYAYNQPLCYGDPLGLQTIVFVSPNMRGTDREAALNNAVGQIEADASGGEIREYQENGEWKVTKPWFPKVGNTVRPAGAYFCKRVNAVLTGHGDGSGGLVKCGKFDRLEDEFLEFLRRQQGSLGRIVIGVCWSQDPEVESSNGPNLCRKASRAAGGRPTWGHEGAGHLDTDGVPTSDADGTNGQPQPGPFRYDDNGPRVPSDFSAGRPR